MKKNIIITDRQKELLKVIYESLKNDNIPPSFDDLKESLSIKSNQAILDHLNALEKKGLIKREEKSARSIKITPLGFKSLKIDPISPLLGASYAGAFTQTMELQGEWLKLPGEVHEYKKEVFFIKVSGDSMINAGIYENDILLVQKQEHFSSGDIVLAQSNDGSTIKRFVRQNKPPFISLRPENPKYNYILFNDDVEMKGKIIAKWELGNIKPLIQGRFL